jgi:hypothetical protein
MRRAFASIVLLSLLGCSEPSAPVDTTDAAPPAPAVPVSPALTFAGLLVPGRAADARKAGYTTCAKGWSGSNEVFVCRPTGPIELFGVAVEDPHVIFDGDGHLTADPAARAARVDIKTADPLSLSYGGLEFGVPASVYDDACVQRKTADATGWAAAIPPEECARPGGVETFRAGLGSDSWIRVSDRRYEVYAKRDVPVTVTINRALASSHSVSIRATSLEEVQEAFARYDDEQSSKRASANAEDAFSEAMSGGGDAEGK